jgi:hypothetical protein
MPAVWAAGARDLLDEPDARGQGHAALATHARGQCLAVEELHDDIGAAVGRVAEIEHLDAAGVAHLGGGTGLVEEAPHYGGVS